MLREEIDKFNLDKDCNVFIQCALSKVGWFVGGISGFYSSLLSILGPNRTIVVPTFTSDLTDPALWVNPAVPEKWLDPIRMNMPVYSSTHIPRGMSKLYLQLLLNKNTLRSDHPHYSFAALGPNAEEIIKNHSLNFGLGEQSPLAKLEKPSTKALLFGSDFSTFTPFHLAQYRAASEALKISYPKEIIDGVTLWDTFSDIEIDDSQFAKIGKKLIQTQGACIRTSKKLAISCIDYESAIGFAQLEMQSY